MSELKQGDRVKVTLTGRVIQYRSKASEIEDEASGLICTVPSEACEPQLPMVVDLHEGAIVQFKEAPGITFTWANGKLSNFQNASPPPGYMNMHQGEDYQVIWQPPEDARVMVKPRAKSNGNRTISSAQMAELLGVTPKWLVNWLGKELREGREPPVNIENVQRGDGTRVYRHYSFNPEQIAQMRQIWHG